MHQPIEDCWWPHLTPASSSTGTRASPRAQFSWARTPARLWPEQRLEQKLLSLISGDWNPPCVHSLLLLGICATGSKQSRISYWQELIHCGGESPARFPPQEWSLWGRLCRWQNHSAQQYHDRHPNQALGLVQDKACWSVDFWPLPRHDSWRAACSCSFR